jgi:hypothetical protein
MKDFLIIWTGNAHGNGILEYGVTSVVQVIRWVVSQYQAVGSILPPW